MYKNRPSDFDQALDVENSLQRWEGMYTRDEVFVSSSLIRLNVLPELNWLEEKEDHDELSCDSGFCFL